MADMNSAQEKIPINTVVLGDCLEFLAQIPDQCLDLIVSSPPYNLGKEYESKRLLNIYLEEQKKVLAECVRVLKTSGSIFWQVGSYSNKGTLIPLDIRFFPIFEDLGMIPRNRIIWIRQHGLHAQNKFSCRHETILWFTKTDEYTFNLDAIRVPQKYQNKKYFRGEKKGELSCNPLGKNPGDIWIFRNVKHNHEEQTIHPCQFPEDMIARIILATTNLGDIVFDPYLGTGTVAVVARDYNRFYLGTELDPNYYQVALRRLKGEPDENNCFPNLKTLRDYVDKTGNPIEKFRFDMQSCKTPSKRSDSRIYPEEHHLEELERRLTYEESAFSAKVRGLQIPVDVNLNGKMNGKFAYDKCQKESPSDQLSLFDINILR
jgi:adenine-specific DNA-methyltransferase